MNDVMKIVKSLEETSLLIKRVSETIENEAKEQKGGFLNMLLGKSGASLLGDLSTGNGAIATSQGVGEGSFRARKNTVRTGQDL